MSPISCMQLLPVVLLMSIVGMFSNTLSKTGLVNNLNEKVAVSTKNGTTTSREVELFQFCSRSQLRNGEWKPVTLEQSPYLPENHSKQTSCVEDDTALHVPWMDYEWVPEEACQFDHFDRDTFCQAAQRLQISKMAIVGDSLTWEHYASLLMLLQVPVRERDQMISMKRDSNVIVPACNGQLQILYRRDDFLHKVWDVLRAFPADLLVLNRGAHYVPDEPLTLEFAQLLTNLTNFYNDPQTNATANPKLVYRTTVPGHPDCHSHTLPINNLTRMEELVASFPKFHWKDFRRQNRLLLELLDQHPKNTTVGTPVSVKIMDAYEINIRRPDKHRRSDCLHSCFPGKMDVYSQILQHYMLMDDW